MIVTRAIIRQDDRFLMCRRCPGRSFAGFWEFPGGRMDPGETIEECLERELFEQLGIRTHASDVIAVTDVPGDGTNYRVMALRTEILGGKPELSVHDAFEWVKKEDFSRYKMTPADATLVTSSYF